MSGWRYVVTPRAARDIERLDMTTRRRVFDALDRLVADPTSGDRKRLRGTEAEWRLRWGT